MGYILNKSNHEKENFRSKELLMCLEKGELELLEEALGYEKCWFHFLNKIEKFCSVVSYFCSILLSCWSLLLSCCSLLLSCCSLLLNVAHICRIIAQLFCSVLLSFWSFILIFAQCCSNLQKCCSVIAQNCSILILLITNNQNFLMFTNFVFFLHFNPQISTTPTIPQ